MLLLQQLQRDITFCEHYAPLALSLARNLLLLVLEFIGP